LQSQYLHIHAQYINTTFQLVLMDVGGSQVGKFRLDFNGINSQIRAATSHDERNNSATCPQIKDFIPPARGRMICQQYGVNGKTIPLSVLHHPDFAVEKTIGGIRRHKKKMNNE
jgi:hypothetical protein